MSSSNATKGSINPYNQAAIRAGGHVLTDCWQPPLFWEWYHASTTIICMIDTGLNTDPSSPSTQQRYEECCPPSSPNGTNIWNYRRDCGGTCYTQDRDLAEGFGACVTRVQGNVTGGTLFGMCEFIDYKVVKKQQAKSGAGRVGGESGKVRKMAALAVVGLLSFPAL